MFDDMRFRQDSSLWKVPSVISKSAALQESPLIRCTSIDGDILISTTVKMRYTRRGYPVQLLSLA